MAAAAATSRSGDRTALRRFEREAQASARLNHTNIITVYDYGSIRTEGAYLVMELIRGSTLRLKLTRAGQLDSQTAADWFTQMLEGVQAAHQLEPQVLLLLQHHGAFELPGVRPDRLRAQKYRGHHHLVAEHKVINDRVMAVELPAPWLVQRWCAEDGDHHVHQDTRRAPGGAEVADGLWAWEI